MNEKFLQFIWQNQYLVPSRLHTVSGEELVIKNPGFKNKDEGPDFLNAKIQIGAIEWVGNVEIHIKSSDWDAHGHSLHPAYESVILHVVYEYESPIRTREQTEIPTCVIKHAIPKGLYEKCQQLLYEDNTIRCRNIIETIEPIISSGMLHRAATERLERKAHEFLQLYRTLNKHWNAALYQWMVENFGFKVNTFGFGQLAQKVPYAVTHKVSPNIMQLESLFFGMAGFLAVNLPDDVYHSSLKNEFLFLKHKWLPNQTEMPLHYWRFLRLRPYNFPTVRIAQMASLFHKYPTLFDIIIDNWNIDELLSIFKISSSDYWRTHFVFGELTKVKSTHLSDFTIQHLFINVVAVVLSAYGIENDDQTYLDKAVALLEYTKAEQNSICDTWKSLGLIIKNAFESQGCLELYHQYCSQRKCLDCMIGHKIIRGKQEPEWD